jgi:hypothetical protein
VSLTATRVRAAHRASACAGNFEGQGTLISARKCRVNH